MRVYLRDGSARTISRAHLVNCLSVLRDVDKIPSIRVPVAELSVNREGFVCLFVCLLNVPATG